MLKKNPIWFGHFLIKKKNDLKITVYEKIITVILGYLILPIFISIPYYFSIYNITFINDSKATNLDATKQALKSFKNIYWIMGGRIKEKGILKLKKYFSNIKHAFLIGETKFLYEKYLKNHLNCTIAKNLNESTKLSFCLAKKEKKDAPIILLSYLLFSTHNISAIYWEFDTTSLMPALVMIIYYSIIKNNWLVFWIAMIFSIGLKENAGVVWVCYGLYFIFIGEKIRFGSFIAGIGLLYMVVVWYIVIPFFAQSPKKFN